MLQVKQAHWDIDVTANINTCKYAYIVAASNIFKLSVCKLQDL